MLCNFIDANASAVQRELQLSRGSVPLRERTCQVICALVCAMFANFMSWASRTLGRDLPKSDTVPTPSDAETARLEAMHVKTSACHLQSCDI